MPFTITLPKLSPTMESGVIAKWHKKVGDPIQPGEVLVEVATDKATIEYNALDGGFLRAILVPEGTEARVNQPIAVCTESANESIENYRPEGINVTPPPAETPTTPVSEAVASAMAAPTPAPAPVAAPSAIRPAPPVQGWSPPQVNAPNARVGISPYAKKLAAERGLDPTSAQGTGPGGRVLARDLASAQPAAPVQFARQELPETVPGTFELEAMTPMRRAVGDRLLASKQQIPHFYLTIDVDAAPLVQCREQLLALGLKVTFNDLVLRAVALSLRQHPQVNSGFDPSTQALIRFKTIDIAVAVSLPQGLITPIVRHADYKSLGEISAEVKQLATKAREGKLQPAEYQGGSFTISNLGMYGVKEFAAILNPPQAAILAVAAIREEPIVRDGQVVPGRLMACTLSVDHRVIDGSEAAQFLATFKTFIESPAGLCLL
ncbi:MAG: dihydrolipoamide acetyltransferase family protein [Chlamydiia bacterium]